MRRPAVPLLAAALATAIAGGGVVGSAQPAPAAPVAQRAGAVRAVIVFDKDPRHPWHSTITWRAMRAQEGGGWRTVDTESWRAGSGLGGPDTTNACHKNVGWLPNGYYSFIQYDDYRGSLIRGRAFFLGAKRCADGTQRTDLFIHTESGAGNRQCADARGDQVCRWEWPRINDYRSHGCIKMSPRDLLDLVGHFHRWFEPGVRYPMSRVQVRVR